MGNEVRKPAEAGEEAAFRRMAGIYGELDGEALMRENAREKADIVLRMRDGVLTRAH